MSNNNSKRKLNLLGFLNKKNHESWEWIFSFQELIWIEIILSNDIDLTLQNKSFLYHHFVIVLLNNNKTFISSISTILLFTITVTAGLLFLVYTIFPQTFAQESEEVFIAPGASDPNNNEGAYVPPKINVPERTIVTWLNDDFIDHTVTANDYRLFDSGPISPGNTFENEFISSGEFGYHCTIHPFMRGMVIVG